MTWCNYSYTMGIVWRWTAKLPCKSADYIIFHLAIGQNLIPRQAKNDSPIWAIKPLMGIKFGLLNYCWIAQNGINTYRQSYQKQTIFMAFPIFTSVWSPSGRADCGLIPWLRWPRRLIMFLAAAGNHMQIHFPMVPRLSRVLGPFQRQSS